MMFLIFLLIITALFDFSRIIISRAQVERTLNTTMLSVLANYSERLKSDYGLLYIDMDDLEIEYEIFRQLNRNLTRVISYDDVLNLYSYSINRNTMSVNENNPLALREMGPLTTQILEYSKYLVPLDLAINNYYGHINYRHLFRDVEQFQGLADGFFYTLNVVEFLEEKIEMDRTLNQLLRHHFEFMNNIDGGIFRTFRLDPNASYINRPLNDADYTESWISGGVLRDYMYKAFEDGRDPYNIAATLDLYVQRIDELIALIGDAEGGNKYHFDAIFGTDSNLLIDVQQSIVDFENFMNTWKANPENSSLVTAGFTNVAQSKIDYYNHVIDSVVDTFVNSEYESLNNQLAEHKGVLEQLRIHLTAVRAYVFMGGQNEALSRAQLYDQLFGTAYVGITVNSTYRNPQVDLYTYMLDFPYFTDPDISADRETILEIIEELIDDKVMDNFFGFDLLGYFDQKSINETPNSIYNPLSRDSFNDVFLDLSFDSGANWVNDWKYAITAPNDWITNLIGICINNGSPEAAKAQEVFAIANFAYTIMHGTRNHIHSMSLSDDDPLDQFFINYYAMKTFRSFFTSSTDNFASMLSPDHYLPLHESRHKRNLERRNLHTDLPHRELRYELEYIIFGAEDFYNSNPAGENESAKYVGLLLYGDRVAKNYAFMRTNPYARHAVNMIASAISSSVPELENRFTEVVEAVALFWAACESAFDMTILKLGGSIYINKPYQDNNHAFHLRLYRFMEEYLEELDNYHLFDQSISSLLEDNIRWTFINHTSTETALPALDIHPFNASYYGTSIYRAKAVLNYDAHLMMLLSRVPNHEKISRIQEVINHNMSATRTDLDYLYNTHAGIDVQLDVTLGMTFLNWDMFRAQGIGAAFDGGFTHEVTWFQMY